MTTETFTQPTLSANGTLGGSSFAVSTDSQDSSYPLWKAFDKQSSTRWVTNKQNCYIIIYNPNPLKITKIATVANSDSWNSIQSLTITGSNDNSTYTNITCSLSKVTANQTITLTNSNFYKYYKLALKGYSGSHFIELVSLTLTAQVQIGTGGNDTISLPMSHSNAYYVPLLSFIGTSGQYGKSFYFPTIKASYFKLTSVTTADTQIRYMTLGY